jgi:hypothetical protein
MEANSRTGKINLIGSGRYFTDLLDTLGTIVSAETKAATEASPDQMRAALILGQPGFHAPIRLLIQETECNEKNF